MPSETFLPRIHSVFYAIFDVKQGPKIVYQVPEGLIATLPAGLSNLSATSSPKSSAVPLEGDTPRPSSRQVSSSPHPSSNRVLFNFNDISKYVIPSNPLCGRLVICATRNHHIIGFPVSILGSEYKRNYFRFNLCFVFERAADLSCYKPIVRKVGRVLAACEEESKFLSSSQSSLAMHAILEQLYEDLNSYSETSIPIDKFNSIELKIFPFYPNPPPVKDWQVPLALINLKSRVEDNWDLTVRKVCEHINGINHVRRIAQLADCDLQLTRQAVAHLLYYQVIMTVDIFQYSNMYTLRKNVQWLADEPHVKDECGPYVTKPGKPVPDWPKLLFLYSRLKPGKTVFEWMQGHDIHELGIDVRRFTSFGVIKGFLRRVHRYPVLLSPNHSLSTNRRRESISKSPAQLNTSSQPSPTSTSVDATKFSGGPLPVSVGSEERLYSPTRETEPLVYSRRRTSAAEKALEQLHSTLSRTASTSSARAQIVSSASPDEGSGSYQARPFGRHRVNSDTRRQSTLFQHGTFDVSEGLKRASLYNPSVVVPTPRSTGISRSPSVTTTQQTYTPSSQGSPLIFNPLPPELTPMLNGEHHTDELSTHFEVGWPLLQQWLTAIGGGKGNGDFGEVVMIYR
ncbi:nitrogen permease regulator 2-domain-containing protein [Pisolithus microcarpus]|nr:nitrogen permease regulator 2-domain-containing protein [Pisolithus microcarpus]